MTAANTGEMHARCSLSISADSVCKFRGVRRRILDVGLHVVLGEQKDTAKCRQHKEDL